MRRPFIRNKRVAVAVGVVALVAAFVLLYDAYDRRGDRPPLILRPFLPT